MAEFDTNNDAPIEDALPESRRPNKTARKREMQSLLKLVGNIAELKPDSRLSLALPDSLALSIEQAAKLKSSNARNRQLRHSAKLIEGQDDLIDRLHQYFADKQNSARKVQQQHKAVEHWRDRLLDLSDNALSDFFDTFPNSDRQELSTLVRNARKEKQREKPPTQQRKLFRYLRDRVV